MENGSLKINDKYLVFGGHHYYPSGGFKDFQGEFESLEEAKEYILSQNDFEWGHIVLNKEIIFSANVLLKVVDSELVNVWEIENDVD